MNRKMIPFLFILRLFWPTIPESIPEKSQKQSRNRNCDSFGIGIDAALNELLSAPLSFLLMLSRIFEIYSIDCLITLRSRCSFYKLGIDFVRGDDIHIYKNRATSECPPEGN